MYRHSDPVSASLSPKDSSSIGGEELLSRLDKSVPRLTDDEVAAIISYLDRVKPCQIYQTTSNQLYRSQDLRLGVKRDCVEQLLDAISAIIPGLGRSTNAAAEHFDLETQEAAFSFIKSDVRIETSLRYPHAWIQLQGVRRTFYHHQLYAAFWLLKEERGYRRGAILADLMGLGKVRSETPHLIQIYD